MEVDNSMKLTALPLTLLLGLSGVWAIQIEMPKTNMEVIRGKTVVLQASYTPLPGTNTDTAIWSFVTKAGTQKVIFYTKNSSTVGSPQFKGRVGFTAQMPSANLSLYINDTQESDSGVFLCQAIIGTDIILAEMSLNIIVPPDVPKCSMKGKPVLRGNVTLSCMSGMGKPVPLYKWKKTNPTSEVFFSPFLNEKTGTLKLSNLSSNMSGKYECRASNTAGTESCFINLEISSSTNAGVIAGATVGAVVGFILLLLFLFFLVKRSRDNEDDMANDIKEDAQAPKRVSWAKSGMGSDIISKNGTLSSVSSSPRHKESSHASDHNHQQLPASHHHHALQQYPQRPPSDTASIITATGSMAGYRPSRHHGASTPTHYGYNGSAPPQGQLPDVTSSDPRSNGGNVAAALPQTERSTRLPQAQPLSQAYGQAQPALVPIPRPPPLPTSVVTAANIARMGGVPIMVPAQNQAGSLV